VSANPYVLQHPYSSLRVETLADFPRSIFIETGTNVGRGIQIALDAGFEQVFSVEEDPAIFAVAYNRYRGNNRVVLACCDSPTFLRTVLPTIRSKAVVYLDAHSVERNPLLEELAVLAEQPRRDHTLLIDDVRMFGSPDWHGLAAEEIRKFVLQVNSEYRFSYRDTNHAAGDLLVAEVP
jgi:hypothetical protein